MVSHLTNFVEVVKPILNQSAEDIVGAFLEGWAATFNGPVMVLIDHATNFNSHLFQSTLRIL